jgi:cellulose synthase/poly-beta-1,6-N-acetylglucosamine synthase-like glycosyltransferase
MNDLSQAQMERIAALVKAEKAVQKDEENWELPCEVTALIKVYNALDPDCGTLFYTLRSLIFGVQSISVKIVLCDNGSTDGSQVILNQLKAEVTTAGFQGSATRAYWLAKFRDIQVVAAMPQNDEYPEGQRKRNSHYKAMYARMLPVVDTDYVLLIDADVDAPTGSLRTMLDALKDDPELGVVAIGYDPNVHIEQGLMMLGTELARSIDWKKRERGCVCRLITDEIQGMGKKALRLNALSARHRKREI